jgi:hypothetical protein
LRESKGASTSGEEFGHALAAGDFDGSGQDDLAIGAPKGGVPGKRVGETNILYGSAAGLSLIANQLWRRDSETVRGLARDGDEFGFALAVGDFGNRLQDDLAIGSPQVDGERAGAVNVPSLGAILVKPPRRILPSELPSKDARPRGA